MLKKLKCGNCGTLMSINSYRCPECGAVITSIDGEQISSEEREGRAIKHYRSKGMESFGDMVFKIALIILGIIAILILASIMIGY